MAAQLISIQRQLHEDYHKDRILTDKLVMSTDDFPDIAKEFKQNYPNSSQEAIQRIAGLLSHDPKSAGLQSISDTKEGEYGFYTHRLGGKSERKFIKGTEIHKTTNGKEKPGRLKVVGFVGETTLLAKNTAWKKSSAP